MTENSGMLIAAGKPTRRFIYVAGVVLPDGSARFEPFEVISTTQDIETRPKGGSYTLVVEGDPPMQAAERTFEPATLSVGGKEQPRPFGLFIPYEPTPRRITLRRGTELLAERQPSAHTPQVALAPVQDLTLQGKCTLSWSASDPGGTELTFSVWYSPDGGQRWLPLDVGLRTTSVDIDVDRLTASNNGRLRVLASNGLNTTEAISDNMRVGSPH